MKIGMICGKDYTMKCEGGTMMCEHEFVQEEWIVEVCKKCGKLQQEIDLEQQLAALIESQQSEINHQNLQIAKLQEDLIKAISGKE